MQNVAVPDGFGKTSIANTIFDKRNGDQYFLCAGCNEYVLSFTMDVHPTDSGRWDEFGNAYCKKCSGKPRRAGTQRAVEISVPPEYTLASMDNLDKRLAARLREWPAKPFLALIGKPGSGKTYSLHALRKDFASRGHFVVMHECARLRAEWAGAFASRRDQIERGLANARLLILDDFTKAEATDGWAQRMDVVLDVRTEYHRPTIIASMHAPEEIAAKYGQAIGSRLKFFHGVPIERADRRTAKVQASEVPI